MDALPVDAADEAARRARRRTPWRRFRRATRGPRNAVLARAIWGAARTVGALPIPVALGLGKALGLGAHAVLRDARSLALRHMAMVLPELDEPTRRRLVRDTFVHAGQAFTELPLTRRLLAREGYVQFEGAEHLAAGLAGGRGVVAVTGHTGHWELLAATVATRFPVTVVARKVNDDRFNDLIVRARRDSGCEVLLRDDPNFLSAARDALRRNRILALLIDQDTRGAGVFVPFFGIPARTPPGAAILAFRGKAPVITAFINRRPEGGHVIRIAPVDLSAHTGRDRITTLTADLTLAIERQIRRAPAEWVWWHERWRNQPPGGSSGASTVTDAT